MKKIYAVLILLAMFITESSYAQRTALESGTKAPNPKLTPLDGKAMKLYEYVRNNDKVLITFLRPVWCPVCNLRTHEMIDNYKKLKEKGYEVIVVYPTPSDKLTQYAADLNIPFVVIADYEERLYRLFQIEHSKQKVRAGLKNKRGKKRIAAGRKLQKKKYQKRETKQEDLISADFVIDSEFNLLNVYYGEYMGDHLPVDTL